MNIGIVIIGLCTLLVPIKVQVQESITLSSGVNRKSNHSLDHH